MAKAKKITGSTIINITNKTKDTTYIIDESVVGTAQVGFLIYESEQLCRALPLKDSDDLCLLIPTYVNNYTATIKYAVITIKDYYKYCDANNDLILLRNDSVYENAKKEKDAGSYFTNDKKVEGELASNVSGGRKNTAYNITQVTKANKAIMDIGGNDKYTLSATYSAENGNFVNIGDYAGNDKYTLTNGSGAAIQDAKGKDTYTIKENSAARINEFGGNDKYTIENTKQTIIQDDAGKDKYTISNAEQFAMYESAGNDTYKLTNVRTTDEHGEIDPGKTLVGDAVGNDKYTVSGSDTFLYINDLTGKDTYNITGVYDKKTKTATYVGHTEIKDEGTGKNTFNVTYSEEAKITAKSNTNVFNIKSSEHVVINANLKNDFSGGKDKYSLTSNSRYDITDYGATGDSYNIINSPTGYIDDYGGNDTYTVNTLNFNPYETEDQKYIGIHIDDKVGNKDCLTLKTTKKDNIVYMTDFYNAGENSVKSWDNSLIIYDKSTQGYAYIKNFYSADENDVFNGFGDGLIETIKASKKKLDVSTKEDYYEYLNSVKADVASWIDEHSIEFSCVEEVLTYGTAEQKAELVAFFDQSGK